jgi:hypothetical protein
MYNIVHHNIRNEAIMPQDFRRKSPYGGLGKPSQTGHKERDGCLEGKIRLESIVIGSFL